VPLKKKPLKIMTVCDAGVGSSVMLRANIIDVMSEYGVKCNGGDCMIITADPLTAKGQVCDVIITQEVFVSGVAGTKAKILLLKNLVSKKELEEKLIPALKELGFI